MTTVKNQLRAFYAKQGLTGKHLRMALRHDMKAVARNADFENWPAWSLTAVFAWSHSPEGWRYWWLRDEK